jgi:hypothetical protein
VCRRAQEKRVYLDPVATRSDQSRSGRAGGRWAVNRCSALGGSFDRKDKVAWIVALLAIGLMFVVLQDACEVMLLSRRVYRRVQLTRFYFDSAWTAWSGLAKLIPAGVRRERFPARGTRDPA